MQGDRLASGARSASFPLRKRDAIERPASGMQSVEMKRPKEVFGECRDCGAFFYSAAEFCAHTCSNESLGAA